MQVLQQAILHFHRLHRSITYTVNLIALIKVGGEDT